MATKTDTHDALNPRVGLVVALDEEFWYVMSRLDKLGDVEHEKRVYYRFRVPGSDVTGVLTVLDTMGLPNAAVAVNDLVHAFKVSLVALVGTAAALDDDLALGDVVIASEIVDYLNQSKIVDDAEDPTRPRYRLAATNWKPSADLLRYVNNFPRRAATAELARNWSDEAHAACRIEPSHRPATGPRYHVAPVASGEHVVGSEVFKEVLKTHHRKLAAVEMEAGGAALAAYPQDHVDLLVLRGLSDRAEATKAATDAIVDVDGRPNALRDYAVGNATRLLTIMLADPGFPWSPREEPPEIPPRTTGLFAATTGHVLNGLASHGLGAAVALPVGYELGHRVTAHLMHDQPSNAKEGERQPQASVPGGGGDMPEVLDVPDGLYVPPGIDWRRHGSDQPTEPRSESRSGSEPRSESGSGSEVGSASESGSGVEAAQDRTTTGPVDPPSDIDMGGEFGAFLG
ncbi:hypothetical protein ABZX40_21165 [Streptomyces sp. NPDC004610]|uniref:5'-methylthioadenosine/S-adenosylhomocysteine nucleosidase family protein n=1 Tax=unclassified Streptomyces TaxID=2593676 RepID=UPI0033AB057B